MIALADVIRMARDVAVAVLLVAVILIVPPLLFSLGILIAE